MIEEDTPQAVAAPRLLDQVRDEIRRRHYSYRTEQTYVHWIKRFIYFSGKRHPREMGAAEVTAFLSHLASEREVAASTQNQALSALLFLYGPVLGVELPWMKGIVRAKRPVRVPVVLTREEVRALLALGRGTDALEDAERLAQTPAFGSIVSAGRCKRRVSFSETLMRLGLSDLRLFRCSLAASAVVRCPREKVAESLGNEALRHLAFIGGFFRCVDFPGYFSSLRWPRCR